MSSDPTPTTGTLRVQRMPRWFTGRSELIVAACVLLLATVVTVGTITMNVPEGASWPGPQFFPTIVSVFLYIVGGALTVQVLRSPQRAHVADDPTEISDELLSELGGIDATSEIRVVSPEDYISAEQQANSAAVDWKTVGTVIAALTLFIVVMPFLGWLISSAALFWVISWAFGSKRPLFDIAVSALFAGIIQLAFSAGLGLSLPAGILEGAFPWIS